MLASERDEGELTRQVGMPCWAVTVWRTAMPVRRSLNAIADSGWLSVSVIWGCVVVVSDWAAERMDVLVMDSV